MKTSVSLGAEFVAVAYWMLKDPADMRFWEVATSALLRGAVPPQEMGWVASGRRAIQIDLDLWDFISSHMAEEEENT